MHIILAHKFLRFSPDIHAASQTPSVHIYLIQAWAFSSCPAPWRGRAPWQRNDGNSHAYVAEPETPKEILNSLPEGYPDTIDDWLEIQKKVWPNAIPVPCGWIRVWSKQYDCEYYLRLEDNYATWSMEMSHEWCQVVPSISMLISVLTCADEALVLGPWEPKSEQCGNHRDKDIYITSFWQKDGWIYRLINRWMDEWTSWSRGRGK